MVMGQVRILKYFILHMKYRHIGIKIIKIRNFQSSKYTIKTVKRRSIHCNINNQGVEYRLYKELP